MENPQPVENNSDSNMDFEAISDDSGGWIQWYCSLEGHDFLVEIDEEFIKDSFNLYGLRKKFSKERYEYAAATHPPRSALIKMILSNSSPNEEDLQNEEFLELNQEASDLYGLTHARFIISQRGTLLFVGLDSASAHFVAL